MKMVCLVSHVFISVQLKHAVQNENEHDILKMSYKVLFKKIKKGHKNNRLNVKKVQKVGMYHSNSSVKVMPKLIWDLTEIKLVISKNCS